MRNYTIKYVSCGKSQTFDIKLKNTNARKYCTNFAKLRKKFQIDASNRAYVSNGKPIGRPRNSDGIEIVNLKNVFAYDEPNILGY